MERLSYAFADGVAIARRNVIKIKRVPEVLVGVLITPLIFVLLFAYVFGSSIDVPGGLYREFLIGGALALTLTFGATFTGAGLADDMQKGIINGFGSALLGFGLLLLFAYAISWIMAYVGLLVPSAEVVNNASTMVIFPLPFIANTFVPADNLPTPLRIFAEWNPVSAVTQAARELFGNVPPEGPEPNVWSLQNPILYTLICVAVIVAVFAPLAVRRYRRADAR